MFAFNPFLMDAGCIRIHASTHTGCIGCSTPEGCARCVRSRCVHARWAFRLKTLELGSFSHIGLRMCDVSLPSNSSQNSAQNPNNEFLGACQSPFYGWNMTMGRASRWLPSDHASNQLMSSQFSKLLRYKNAYFIRPSVTLSLLRPDNSRPNRSNDRESPYFADTKNTQVTNSKEQRESLSLIRLISDRNPQSKNLIKFRKEDEV